MHVFVINHKKFENVYQKGYYPLLVGAYKAREDWKKDVYCDDTGEHISEWNDSYCELTGLYWMWKNCKEPIIGLVHYRRFFVTIKPHKIIPFHSELYMKDPHDYKTCHIMTEDEAMSILQKYDLIVHTSRTYHWTLRDKLLTAVPKECIDNFEAVLSEEDPLLVEAFGKYMNRHSHLLFSMFIGKKEVIDRYCEWLFPLLVKADVRHLKTTGRRYRHREIGYLGENAFHFWLEQNHISYYCTNIVGPGKSQINEFDGVKIEGGTNIHYKKELLPELVRLGSKKVIAQRR